MRLAGGHARAQPQELTNKGRPKRPVGSNPTHPTIVVMKAALGTCAGVAGGR